MTNKKTFALAGILLASGLSAVGCSSNSSCADGGICDTGGAGGGGGGAGGAPGPALYKVSAGTYCFDILAIAPGAVDGCGLGVAGYVAAALPVSYYATAGVAADGTAVPAGTVEVGNQGSLGRGVINQNAGTLERSNTQTLDPPNNACSWVQMDTSQFQLTADNTFSLSVTETQSNYTGVSACAAAAMPAPAGGSCTSTWTWTMAIENPQVHSAATGCQ